MAFIKRSTSQPVKVTVGSRTRKCTACGRPFVCKQKTNLCSKCIPRTVTENNDGTTTEGMPDFDLE